MASALEVARCGAMKALTQTSGQIDALIVSAPQAVRQLRGVVDKHRIRACAALRPRPTDLAAATKLALRSAARRWRALQAEIDDSDTSWPLVTAATPALALSGIGVYRSIAAATRSRTSAAVR
jgi:transposase